MTLKEFNQQNNIIDNKLLDYMRNKGYTLVLYKDGKPDKGDYNDIFEILKEYIQEQREQKINELLK